MIAQLNGIKKVIFFIAMVILAGCTQSGFVALQGHGISLKKAEHQWSRDFGPKKSGHFRSIATGDFNNDGYLDIAGGSYEPGAIFVWLGDGNGNWERKQRFKIRADIRSIAAGDINNDGWIDLVSSSTGDTKGIQIWINQNGTFFPGKPITESELFEGIRLSDINKDGNLDVIAANSTGVEKGGVRVWLGNGRGSFPIETGPTRHGIYRDVAVGDFNNDTHIDIVGAGWLDGSGTLRIWLGSGDGRWSSYAPIERASFWGVSTADVDNDGNIDIITAANFDGVKIYYGDGKGDFPRQDILAEKGSFRMSRGIDIDMNGLMDIVATSNDNNGIVIWYQDKYRKWVPKDDGLPVDGFYFDFVAADFNRDDKVDLAIASYAEGIRTWFRGSFQPTIHRAESIKIKKKTVMEERVLLKKTGPEEIDIPDISMSIFFDSNSAALRPESIVVLNNVVESLKKYKDITVRLEGHADPGKIIVPKNFLNNQALSLGRAERVADFLISSGTEKERVTIFAFGDVLTSDSNADPDVYKNRRRVDITMTKKQGASLKKEEDPLQVKKINTDNKTDSTPLDPSFSQVKNEFENPFAESGDVVPVTEYKVFKVVNNIPEYRIGAGDKLEITLWEGIVEKRFNVVVLAKGTVSFSFITNFFIEGLTPTETENEFVRLLKSYIKKPFVRVVITDKRAHHASIFGAVRSLSRQPTGPGTYLLYGKERLTEFLSRVGGHLTTADLTHVQLTRDNKTYFLNIFDALFKGDFRQDILIDEGDVIFIPSKSELKKSVYVMGEVRRPGMFQYDRSLSLLEAIIKAGGPTFYGKTTDVVIVRGDTSKPEAVKVNFEDIVEKGDFRKNLPLQNGDIVFIAKNTIGNVRKFLMNITPFLDLLRVPMEVYAATALPVWEGYPLRREVAQAPSTLISSPPNMPPDSGAWTGK